MWSHCLDQSAEIALVPLPLRRTSFCSIYNSSEDGTTTLVSSEVDERQHGNVGFTTARAQEKQVQTLQATITPRQAHLTFEAQGDSLRCTHIKRKSGRDPTNVHETYRK